MNSGSFSTGVLSSNLAQCQPGFQSGRGPPDPCGDYGTYDNTSSSTAYYVGTGYYDNLIDAAYGNFIGDVVRTGGQTFNNFTFGQITREAYGEYFSEKYEGIFGLNAKCYTNGTCDLVFLQQLYDQGVISSKAYSIYPGSQDVDSTGSLLIGGVDRAKSASPPVVLDIADPAKVGSLFAINYTAMSITSGGNTTSFDIAPLQDSIIDTGNPHWTVPPAVFDCLNDNFWHIPGSISIVRKINPPYAVDCSALDTDTQFTIGFLNDAEITIPVKRLAQRNGTDGTGCITAIASCPDAQCGHATAVNAWGHPFVSNVYATFNPDNRTVALSPVRITNEEMIEAI